MNKYNMSSTGNTATFDYHHGRVTTSASVPTVTDLKASLNQCNAIAQYTKISDLREECPYKVLCFERVNTQYGEAVMSVLEGHAGEDAYLRVYLPKRFAETLSDRTIAVYNTEDGEKLHIVKRRTMGDSKMTPIEFV